MQWPINVSIHPAIPNWLYQVGSGTVVSLVTMATQVPYSLHESLPIKLLTGRSEVTLKLAVMGLHISADLLQFGFFFFLVHGPDHRSGHG